MSGGPFLEIMETPVRLRPNLYFEECHVAIGVFVEALDYETNSPPGEFDWRTVASIGVGITLSPRAATALDRLLVRLTREARP